MPPASLTNIADNIPLIPEIIFSPYVNVDGTGTNVRKIVINFSSNLIADLAITFTAVNEFGLIVEENVTIAEGFDSVSTQGFYSKLYKISFTDPPQNYTIDIGCLNGYSPWIGGQYFRQSHQIIVTGGVVFTVYGTLTDDFKPTITTTSADFYPFPLSTALTNATATILTPAVIEYPTGNVRIALSDGSGSLVWKVGNMMVL